jgi:hypothetical protein
MDVSIHLHAPAAVQGPHCAGGCLGPKTCADGTEKEKFTLMPNTPACFYLSSVTCFHGIII